MIEREFIVQNKLGLHARPAALFVQATHRFNSLVRVSKDGQQVDGKSIMGILTLAAEHGSKLIVAVDGVDEAGLIAALEDLFKRRFDEE
jgi:phosphocarrier protein